MKSFSKAVFLLLAASSASADNIWERVWGFSESSELSHEATNYKEEAAVREDTVQLADEAPILGEEEADVIVKKDEDKEDVIFGEDKNDSSKSGKAKDKSGDSSKSDKDKSGDSSKASKSKDKSDSSKSEKSKDKSDSSKSSKSSGSNGSSGSSSKSSKSSGSSSSSSSGSRSGRKCLDEKSPSVTRDGDKYKFKLKKKDARCLDKNGDAYEFGQFDDIKRSSDCADACVKDVRKDVLDGFQGFDFDCKNKKCMCLYDEGTLDSRNGGRYDRVNRDKKGSGKIKDTKNKDGMYCSKLEDVKSVFTDKIDERGALRGYN